MNAAWETIGTMVRRRRAANPGPMTLDGTNSYVVAAPGAHGVVVVDPGPLLEDHLADLAAAGAVELILITHHHGDHTDGSARLHELTGAPVRAALSEFCHGADALYDGELIQAGGLTIEVLATPGHTSDSLCFAVTLGVTLGESGGALADTEALNQADPETVIFTGDTILGSGSTVICHPDGKLGDYLASLALLRNRGSNTQGSQIAALPGHGPELRDIAAAAQGYEEHRASRIAEVVHAVELLHKDGIAEPTPAQVASIVYGDIPENLQGAARLSVEAQLAYLCR
ncbi:MBL fold metallo-hydrolase [Arthrobacter sp. N199823]|uniref:MBL fold metallo-hydrolase n=1 Tax=Arthrobacter sp. N199823 TaxID=2058895 RepID=UPI000CE56D18|nr:MBL fold metallo-hydrolase [Arthrobacter sp. N199823]